MRLRKRAPERGVVLIVVVGVLAVLSLLAATFGMIMSVELTASRNQTDYEVARQAAHAGAEYLIRCFRDAEPAVFSSGVIPDFCPNHDDPFFCQELYRREGLKLGFLIHMPERTSSVISHAALTDPNTRGPYPWLVAGGLMGGAVGSSQTVGLQQPGMFNINSMGQGGMVNSATVNLGNHYSTFEMNLAALISARLNTIGGTDLTTLNQADKYNGTFAANIERLSLMIAHAIVSRRWGANGAPGTPGYEDHHLDNAPDWARWTPVAGLTGAGRDNGVRLPGLFWGRVGTSQPAAPTTTLAVDTTQPGWEDWKRPDLWDGKTVCILNGALMGSTLAIAAGGTGASTLTLTNSMATVPAPGDIFCISDTNMIGAGDGVPTTYVWPEGTTWGENYVVPLVVDVPSTGPGVAHIYGKGRVQAMPIANRRDLVQLDQAFASNALAGLAFRIPTGPARGQVRLILSNTDASGTPPRTLTLSAPLVVPPLPAGVAAADLNGTVASWANPTLTFNNGGAWPRDTLIGATVEVTTAGKIQRATILSNAPGTVPGTGNVTVAANAFTVAPLAGDTYVIYYDGYLIERNEYLSGPVGTPNGGVNPDNTLRLAGAVWTADIWAGCVVTITDDPGNPSAVGQSRLIISNTADTLTLARRWRVNPTAGGSSPAHFRIELPQDAKYRPNGVTGDDTIYRSVAEVLSVLTDVLQDEPPPASPDVRFDAARAGQVAGILFNSFKDFLTVSSNEPVPTDTASVNDWACDGIDNDGNGAIDDSLEAGWENGVNRIEVARRLYERLGLKSWAHANNDAYVSARVPQAAQLVANIIDFRDADDVPTTLTATNLRESTSFTVYGIEGVHITEVMAVAPQIDNTLFLGGADAGTELKIDGFSPGMTMNPTPPPAFVELNDGKGWDWDAAGQYWKVASLTAPSPPGVPASPQGEWRFDGSVPGANYGFKAGWYAIRIHGTSDIVYEFEAVDPDTLVGTAGEVTTDATGWGYARYATPTDKRLIAIRVNATPKLVIRLRPKDPATAVGVIFDALQLLPQYVELTNCAAHDVPLDALSYEANWFDLTFGGHKDPVIRAATDDGFYPVKYGFYVIALSEDAYERQWGGGATAAGKWGANPQQDYPVIFLGDPQPWEVDAGGNSLATLADTRASQFMIAMNHPKFKVHSRDAVIAQTGDAVMPNIDGDVGADAANGGTWVPYAAAEKAGTPFSRTWVNAVDTANTFTTLTGSQNMGRTNLAGMGNYAGRCCLNRYYDGIWTAPPANDDNIGGYQMAAGGAFSSTTAGAANYNRTWPVILNRPYPSPGWLGLVPTGNMPWRTIDTDIIPPPGGEQARDRTEKLLGLLLAHAVTGGIQARVNLVNPSQSVREATFSTVFPAAMATDLGVTNWGVANPTPPPARTGWADWDVLINDMAGRYPGTGGSWPQDPDAVNEEWARRYSGMVTINPQGMTLRYIVAGLAFDENARAGDPPVAQVRIQIDAVLVAGQPRVTQMRYLTQ